MTGARVTSGAGARDEATAARLLRDAGLQPRVWGNAPGDTYDRHEHGYAKVLYCIAGSIIFHTEAGDLVLRAGDRLDVPARTPHAATVGGDGVRCVEGGG